MHSILLAFDIGTSGLKASLVDENLNIIRNVTTTYPTHHYPDGGCEQESADWWMSAVRAMMMLRELAPEYVKRVDAIGVSGHMLGCLPMDKEGQTLRPAMIHADTRALTISNALRARFGRDYFYEICGNVLSPASTLCKTLWLKENEPELYARTYRILQSKDYLVYRLTGQMETTDMSDASHGLLMNLETLDYDEELLALWNIPRCLLPKIVDTSGMLAVCETVFASAIPITVVVGDQQAALFGQTCFDGGDVKNTYGTGCFLLMNTGEQVCESKNGLLTTIGIHIAGKTQYALEGSVFIGGAVIQWLRDEMRFFSESRDAEYYAKKVPDTGGDYLVPAFTGLGAPYWDMYARGCLVGLTRGTTREHIIRAAQESIAYQVWDLADAMEKDTGISLKELNADGGASRDSFLMQFQADILNKPVCRPKIRETTALGAAYLAGLAVGFWSGREEIRALRQTDRLYQPDMTDKTRERLLRGWHKAVGRSLNWAEPQN